MAHQQNRNLESSMTFSCIQVGDYLLEKQISKGAYEAVFKGRNIKTDTVYAIKRIEKVKFAKMPSLRKLLNTEMSIMFRIKHPNILHLHAFFETANNYYLILDFCNQGDLEQALKKAPGGRFDEASAVNFLKQIMNGFIELRKHKVLHRDFKLANIFLTDNRVVIGDFGFAKKGEEVAQTRLGTPLTMAPEILIETNENSSYTSKADLWSIGCVFYELLFGTTPFLAHNEREIIKKIKATSGDKLTFPSQVSEQTKDLLRRLLQEDSKRRIEWNEFFNHPVFTIFQNTGANAIKGNKNFGQYIANNPNKADEEFNRNKGKQVQFTGFKTENDLLTETGMNPVAVKETPIYGGNIQLLLKEINYRYNHEKNKILFLNYTALQLDDFARQYPQPNVQYILYNLKLLLLKKCITLNFLVMINLSNKINTYGIPQEGFNEFLSSPNYQEVYKRFYDDHQNMVNLFKQKSENAPVQITNQDLLKQTKPAIESIDKALWDLYLQLKQLTPTIDAAREKAYYGILMCLTCSIYSESSFPYKSDDIKFRWDTFYIELTNFTSAELKNLIV